VPLALSVETGGALAQRALQGVLWVAAFLFLRDTADAVALFFALATLQLIRAPR
jgi:hypothetical protein